MRRQQNKASKRHVILQVAALGTIGLALGLAGCASLNGNSQSTAEATPANAEATASVSSGKTGAQLWAENCARCHNLRSPSEFSAAEWPIIVQEMRVRAPLTGEQERKITEFLQSASQ